MKLALLFLFALSTAHAAEFSLYAIKSPVLMNWSTPNTLLKSALKGAMAGGAHQIGHAYVGIKCDGEEEILTGMTSGPGFSSRGDLFKKGHGLSVLIQDNPGRLEQTEEIIKAIEKLSKGNRMSAFKLKITNEQCHSMKDWQAEYASRLPLVYGGVDKRPLRGEGAGCTAYAMSYLEYAGVDFAYFDSRFAMTIFMPNELMGGDHGERHVGLFSIYRNNKRLSVESRNSTRVDLYDPNTMYLWILKQVAEIQKTGHAADLAGFKATTSKLNKTKILHLE